jgi:hypothetical protein
VSSYETTLSFSSSWCLRWILRASRALWGKSMVRRLAFLGSLNTREPGLSPSLRILWSWRFTRRVPASRSISDHFKPIASPILRSHVRERMYKHSNLSLLAAS